MRKGLIAGASAGLLLAAFAGAAPPEQTVPLEVRDLMHAERSEVVTSGVPLAPGFLGKAEPFRLVDGRGEEVPCAPTVLASWPDGSVKWLLLDFPLRLGAGEAASLRLSKSAPKAQPPDSSLKVEASPARFVIHTGALTARINRQRFTFFDQVALEGRPGNLVEAGESVLEVETTPPGPPEAENWLRNAAGGPRQLYRAAIARSEVEFQNAERLVVLLEGSYQGEAGRFGPFRVRYTFWNGSAKIGVEHFFAVDVDVKAHFLRSASLRLHLPSREPLSVGFCLEKRALFQVPEGSTPCSLTEVMPDRFYHGVPWDAPRDVRFEVTAGQAGGETVLRRGAEASGLVSIGSSNGHISIALRDFNRLHPKEITVDRANGTLDYHLWPERGGKVLDLRRRYDEIRQEGQYDRGNNSQEGRGVGKTHELLFDFSAEEPGPEALASLSAQCAEPLRAFPPPEHFAQTGVFGPFSPVDTQRFPRWEAMMRLQWEYILRLPGLFHWDGIIDWGDLLLHDYEAVPHKQQAAIPKHAFIVRGYDGWLNNDTNVGREILTAFLRSRDDRLWRLWEREVMHVMDVDTVHGDRSPRRIGAGRRHDQQHWGSVLCGYGTAAVEASDLYYLTGSLWGRSMALLYADWYLRDGGTEWPTKLAAVVRAWEITGAAKYRDFLASPACLEDAQLLKLGTGQVSALDHPSWRTAGTESGVILLRQMEGGEKWKGQFVEASRNLLRTAPLGAQRWGVRTLAYGYLDSGDGEILSGLLSLLHSPVYLPRQADYFTRFPDLDADPAALDFESLAERSKELRAGPSVRTIIYTYRVLPAVMEALKKAGLDEAAIFPKN